jgi:hypothetical protein
MDLPLEAGGDYIGEGEEAGDEVLWGGTLLGDGLGYFH